MTELSVKQSFLPICSFPWTSVGWVGARVAQLFGPKSDVCGLWSEIPEITPFSSHFAAEIWGHRCLFRRGKTAGASVATGCRCTASQYSRSLLYQL